MHKAIPFNMHKGRPSIQRDTDKLEEWDNGNLMGFIKNKHQPLLQGGKSSLYFTGCQVTAWGAALQKMPWVSWWGVSEM